MDDRHMRDANQSLSKLLVKRAGSDKFLRATGRWTKRAEQALNFPNLVSAVHACLVKGLKEVEVILRFEGDHKDRSYPLKCE